MYALLAAVPILVTVVLMVGFNWPAKRALPLAWFLACVVGMVFWKMGIHEAASRTVAGFLSAFETFGHHFWRHIADEYAEALRSHICHQPYVQRHYARCPHTARYRGLPLWRLHRRSCRLRNSGRISSPSFDLLGFPPLAAATCALIYNSTPVCPGPVGIPTLTASSVVADACKGSRRRSRSVHSRAHQMDLCPSYYRRHSYHICLCLRAD